MKFHTCLVISALIAPRLHLSFGQHSASIYKFFRDTCLSNLFLSTLCSRKRTVIGGLLKDRHIKRLACVLVVCCLAACSGKPALESQAVINLNNNLAQLQQWKLKGKIAFISPSQRKSAYMNWQQNNRSIQFDLSSVLGINVASLSFDGQLAILQADGKTYQDPSPSALIYQTTGWQVPLEQLSTWVKGAASPVGRLNNKLTANDSYTTVVMAQNTQQITRYENGLIKQIKPVCANEGSEKSRCDQWTIDYTSYANVTINNIQYQLPTQINMYNSRNQATIKMRISEWTQ